MNNIKNLCAESAETYISTEPPSASGFHGNARQQTHTACLHLLVLHVLQFSLKVREDLQTSDDGALFTPLSAAAGDWRRAFTA